MHDLQVSAEKNGGRKRLWSSPEVAHLISYRWDSNSELAQAAQTEAKKQNKKQWQKQSWGWGQISGPLTLALP